MDSALSTSPLLVSTSAEEASTPTRKHESSVVREIPSERVTSISRDEMNLAEFPLAVLSTRTDPSIKTLEFRDVQRLRSGEVIERQWIITGADKFGLPTSTDDDVVLGLIRLSMDHGFRDRKVFFTRYELLRILRWSTEGRSYSRLTKSLDRLSGVRIKASNAFFDNASKGYQTRNFGIIDAYELNDERGLQKASGRNAARKAEKSVTKAGSKSIGKAAGDSKSSFFIWSEALFESFKSGFIKRVDLDLYFSLRSAISRRLYRYLDKHFYYRAVVERPLMEFAFEKLGLARSYKFVSSVKQQLAPALQELGELKFLDHVEYEGQGNDTIIRFFRGNIQAADSVVIIPNPNQHQNLHYNLQSGAASAELHGGGQGKNMRVVAGATNATTNATANTNGGAETGLHQELLLRGLSQRQVNKLLQNRSAEEQRKISAILRYFDFLVSKQDRRVSKNPVGFLYRAVEAPYRFIVPECFEKDKSGRNGSSRSLRREASPSRERGYERGDERGGGAGGRGKNETSRELYEVYFKERLKQIRVKTNPDELAALYQQISQKMEPLRRALEADSFSQALERLVNEELARRNGLPDFRGWQSRGAAN